MALSNNSPIHEIWSFVMRGNILQSIVLLLFMLITQVLSKSSMVAVGIVMLLITHDLFKFSMIAIGIVIFSLSQVLFKSPMIDVGIMISIPCWTFRKYAVVNTKHCNSASWSQFRRNMLFCCTAYIIILLFRAQM